MAALIIVLHGSLGDFPPERPQGRVEIALLGRASLKDLVESIGVPHPEVGSVLVDGVERGLDFVLDRAARLDVHPSSVLLDEPRFVADGHLGRLAAYLRALGFDTLYDRYADDATIAREAHAEQRAVLTRDVGLLKRSLIERGRWIRSTRPAVQLAEVVDRFELARRACPFTRCVVCNAGLVRRPKSEVAGRVPPRSLAAFDHYSECPTCARVYWPGTHYAKLRELFRAVGVHAEL